MRLTALIAFVLTVIAVIGFANTPKVYAEVQVYEFRCLPDVNQAQVNAYRIHEKSADALDFAALKQNGLLYPLWSKAEAADFKHSCLIDGKKLEVQLEGIELTEEEHGQPCRDAYGYLLKVNATLDAKPVIDNLLFDGGCTDDGAVIGEHLTAIKFLPTTEYDRLGDMTPDIYLNIDMAMGDAIMQTNYAIKFAPPYDPDLEGWQFEGRALNNDDIHTTQPE